MAAKDPGSPVNLITNLAVRDIFIQSVLSAHYLFAELVPEIHVPDLESLEQAGVDFVKLSEVYEAYGKAGLEPELILAPVNLSLESWKKLYSNLCVWQDINDPRSPNKLQRHPSGGGLWVLEYIENHYKEIIGKDLCSLYGRRIIAGGGASCALSDDDLPADAVVWQAAVIPAGENGMGEKGAETDARIPVGCYLTLQAERLYLKKSPIDKNGCTKLGIIKSTGGNTAGENNSWVYMGNFGAGNGQVNLYGYEIKARKKNADNEWGNVRVPVWG
jgi:hypothetical protein